MGLKARCWRCGSEWDLAPGALCPDCDLETYPVEKPSVAQFLQLAASNLEHAVMIMLESPEMQWKKYGETLNHDLTRLKTIAKLAVSDEAKREKSGEVS